MSNYHNYQLLRSNVLLGGNMQWSLTLSAPDRDLQVSDFHITPISRWVDFNKYSEEDLLNYKHVDNIRDFFEKTKGQFFDQCVNPTLKTNYPIVAENPNQQDTYWSDFDMGMSRAKYSIYGKQFQLFCPVWLENFSENSVIKFKFEGYTTKQVQEDGRTYTQYSDTPLFEKTLVIDNQSNSDYHNRFVQYFREYVHFIEDENGIIGDHIIDIDHNNAKMLVEGLNVADGTTQKRDISIRLNNLYSRIRPKMELDSMIIEELSSNFLIAKQLFNFNFLFNLDDITNVSSARQLRGVKIGFRVKVYVDDVELDVKAFNANYGFELDYLKDYINEELTTTNKLTQDVINWSLIDSDSYIFNIYPGYNRAVNVLAQTDIDTKRDASCINWCKGSWMLEDSLKVINSVSQLSDICSGKPWYDASQGDLAPNKAIAEFMRNFTDLKLSDDKNFIDDNRYEVTRESRGAHLFIIEATSNITSAIWNDFKLYFELNQGPSSYITNIQEYVSDVDKYILYRYSTGYYILVATRRSLAFANFSGEASNSTATNTLSAIIIENCPWSDLKDSLQAMMNYDNDGNRNYGSNTSSILYPPIFTIDKSLQYERVDGPDLDSIETTYFKRDIPAITFFRYDGWIKPNFTDSVRSYKITCLTKEDYLKNYDYYIGTGFLPKYPSINYSYLAEYDFSPEVDLDLIEEHRFDRSKFIVLDNQINTTFKVRVGVDTPLADQIRSFIKSRYNLTTDREVNYVLDLYNIKTDYDYANLSDIYEYIYEIKMTLK